MLLGLLDQTQYYLWTSRPKLPLHAQNKRPKFILLGPNTRPKLF